MEESKKGATRRPRGQLGDLYKLLEKSFPTYLDRDGHLDLTMLGSDLGIRKQAIYKWTQKDKVPAKRVSDLIELSDGRLTVRDLEPFLF